VTGPFQFGSATYEFFHEDCLANAHVRALRFVIPLQANLQDFANRHRPERPERQIEEKLLQAVSVRRNLDFSQ